MRIVLSIHKCAALMLLGPVTAVCQAPNTAKANFSISVSVSPSSVPVGGAIQADIVMQNLRKETIYYVESPRTGFGTYFYNAAGKEISDPVDKRGEGVVTVTVAKTLEAGGRVDQKWSIKLPQTLTTPGQYTFEVQRLDVASHTIVHSNRVQLTVTSKE